MQTCKKCLHYEVCRLGNLQYQTPYERYETKFIKKLDSSRCGNFKDRSRFIELPYALRVGDCVFFIFEDDDCDANAINGWVIGEPQPITEIGSRGFWLSGFNDDRTRMDDFIPYEEIGKTFFLTPEAAEKALKERNDERK